MKFDETLYDTDAHARHGLLARAWKADASSVSVSLWLLSRHPRRHENYE